jgi:hypothetical protein
MLGANATLAAWDGRLKDYGRLEGYAHARAARRGTRQCARGVERIVMAACSKAGDRRP